VRCTELVLDPLHCIARERRLGTRGTRGAVAGGEVPKYDEAPVPRGTSHRWEVLISADEEPPRIVGARRTALEVRAEHRVLQGFSDTDLTAMPLAPEGVPLVRRAWYIDLHDPARAEFMAEGDEVVDPGQHVVARTAVPAEIWAELRRACDAVLRRSPSRLRPAV
jgi:hypothetical protein